MCRYGGCSRLRLPLLSEAYAVLPSTRCAGPVLFCCTGQQLSPCTLARVSVSMKCVIGRTYLVLCKLVAACSQAAVVHFCYSAAQVLPVLELFAGGGGISHIARSSDKVQIMHGWANDNNQSACATYNCNVPEAHVSGSWTGLWTTRQQGMGHIGMIVQRSGPLPRILGLSMHVSQLVRASITHYACARCPPDCHCLHPFWPVPLGTFAHHMQALLELCLISPCHCVLRL